MFCLEEDKLSSFLSEFSFGNFMFAFIIRFDKLSSLSLFFSFDLELVSVWKFEREFCFFESRLDLFFCFDIVEESSKVLFSISL